MMALVRDVLALGVSMGLLLVAVACLHGWIVERREREEGPR
jgi:hypothetical protein